ncbi:hypothetical protein AB0I98_13735 [Streptomyces sp. NPDC050211]|uniref:hypothetical protein n=1 Tax=Streptomyces sp. NPDC050211 TaxID=3154932 RepID=UPI00343ED388
MFGSVARLRQVAVTGVPATATIVAARRTASAIGAELLVRLDLVILGRPVTRHVRVRFHHAAEGRPGRSLPVRTDPADVRAMIDEWDLL